jgi:drug/metabolite transporter (DMT)-like permease
MAYSSGASLLHRPALSRKKTLPAPPKTDRTGDMDRMIAHGLMLVTAFIWGTTFVAQTTGMETIGPLGFTWARYLVGAVFVLPLALFEMRQASLLDAMRSDRRLFWQALGLGVLMFGGIALQQTALLHTKVANAAFLTALYVPAVPLLAWLFIGQPVRGRIWLAVLFSLLGSWALSGASPNLLAQWGDFLVMIGALFWAGHILLIGFVTPKIKAPFQLAVLQSLVCVILAGAPMILLERPALADFPPVGWQILYAGILSVGIAYTSQLVAQRYSDPTTAAFILSLESVFAAWAGWQFLNQQLSWMALTGCVLIFIAVCLADVLPAGWLRRKPV